MNLDSLSTSEIANKGRAVELIHPGTQVLIGKRFFVLGYDSEEAKRILRDQELAQQEKQKKNPRRIYMPTPEEKEENALDFLVGLTTGWEENVLDVDGKKVVGVRPEIELKKGEFIPFSREACRAIYATRGFAWIRELVDGEIGDRRDFLPPAKRG